MVKKEFRRRSSIPTMLDLPSSESGGDDGTLRLTDAIGQFAGSGYEETGEPVSALLMGSRTSGPYLFPAPTARRGTGLSAA
jgi:hypothetical protein